MRIEIKTEDGRALKYGGRSRYVAFRLTGAGGFSVTSSRSAVECVEFARRLWRTRGYNTLVIDSTNGEAIAVYPYIEKNMPAGHRPLHKGCETCGGGWHLEGDTWIVDHDIECVPA